jgi:hypothetical protein
MDHTLRVIIWGLAIVVLLAFLVWSCQPSRFEPKKPEEKYSDSQASIPKLVSVVNIPIEISVAEIQHQINTQVQSLIYEDNSLEDNDNDNLLMKVWKRENIQVEVTNDEFLITVPLKVWAKKGVNVLGMTRFQETTFSLNARFITRIGVKSDWRLVTSTDADGYDWIEKPYIKIAFIEVPITGIVSRVLDQEQQKIATQLDDQLAQQLDLKPFLQKVWQLMQQPVHLSQQYDAWLQVTPLEIWMTPLKAQGQAVQARIGIKGHTETIIGHKPAAKALSPMPDLRISEQAADDFQLGLTGEISHSSATQIAASELVGKTFEFQNGSRKVTITSIDLYGNNSNLVIKTGISGSLNGTVYLVGKPFFNPKTQSIELRNMDFSLDTKDRLLKVANWMAHGTLVKKMQENLQLPLGPQLELARQNLKAQLVNKQLIKGISLNGTLDEFTPGDVFITPQSIIAVVTAKGKLDIKINGL